MTLRSKRVCAALVGVAVGMLCVGVTIAVFSRRGTPRDTAMAWIAAHERAILGVSRDIWECSETGLRVGRSSERLIDFLEEHGFSVERDVSGMPTAFVATWGTELPAIGFLAEYDLRPSLSQDGGPEPQARLAMAAGHGCGHTPYGAASTAAAIAMKVAMQQHRLAGTIHLYGVPAQEIAPGAGESGQGPTYDHQGSPSWPMPVIRLGAATYPINMPGLSWHVVTHSRRAIGEQGMVVAAKALALSGLDVLIDQALRAAAVSEFGPWTKGVPFGSLLPDDARAPASIW